MCHLTSFFPVNIWREWTVWNGCIRQWQLSAHIYLCHHRLHKLNLELGPYKKKCKKTICVSDAECRIIFKTLSFYNQSSSQVVIKFCNLSQWLVSCRLVFLMYGNHMKNKTHTYVGSMMPFFTVETKRCITVG